MKTARQILRYVKRTSRHINTSDPHFSRHHWTRNSQSQLDFRRKNHWYRPLYNKSRQAKGLVFEQWVAQQQRKHRKLQTPFSAITSCPE